MKSRSVCFAGILGVVVYAGFAISADQRNDRAELSKKLAELIVERVETATSGYQATQVAFDADTVGIPQLLTASKDLFEAELATCATPQARIAAHQKYCDRTLISEKKTEALFNAGVKGGEEEKYRAVKLARETADIELIRTKLARDKAE